MRDHQPSRYVYDEAVPVSVSWARAFWIGFWFWIGVVFASAALAIVPATIAIAIVVAAAAKTAMAIMAGTMASANEAKTTPIQNQNPIQKARAQLTDTGTDSSYV